jgi:hypothetical protein
MPRCSRGRVECGAVDPASGRPFFAVYSARMGSGSRGPKSATEVMADKERRLQDDPAYRAEVERIEAERAAQVAASRAAERPVLEDLANAGIKLDTVWQLHQHPEWVRTATPILLEHLDRDYPDQVLMGIGQGLDQKASRDWWGELRRLYLWTSRDVVRDRLAAAMSRCATREHYEDLLGFLDDKRLGESRIYFVRAVNRIGNRMSPGRGRAAVESYASDAVLGKEASAVLAGRRPNS